MFKEIVISSSSNPQYKILSSLTQSKGIKEHQMFFLMGEKIIHEYLKNPTKSHHVQFVVQTKNCPKFHTQLPSDVKIITLPQDLFKSLDPVGTGYPLLVLDYKKFPTFDESIKPQQLEIICPLGDPRNLGALCRSALAFGVQNIILTSEATHPYLPISVKSSAGAVLHTNFLQTNKKLSEFEIIGANFALDQNGKNLAEWQAEKNMRLWIGEEGPGLQLTIDQKKKLQYLGIPTSSNTESLNAGVAATLAIWEWKKKFNP